jgi:hypothetical protein
VELDNPCTGARSPRPARPVRAALAGFAMLLALAPTLGCGGDDAALLGSYLDELEFNAPLESAVSISLGEFDVPAPTNIKRIGSDGVEHLVWMRIHFELFAETLPQHESAVLAELERHRGALNDAVLSIVRSASTDELTDPRSTALRMKLSEATRPLLGEDEVRQLVLFDHTTEQM